VRVEITKPQSTIALTEIRVFGPSAGLQRDAHQEFDP
jgi:hypothetical protein